MIFVGYTERDDVPQHIRAALDAAQPEWWDDLDLVVVAPGEALTACEDDYGKKYWDIEPYELRRVVEGNRMDDQAHWYKLTVDGIEYAVGIGEH